MTELFNEHFVHIADSVREIEEQPPKHKSHPHEQWPEARQGRLSFHLKNKTQIEELLSNINARKACGHDMLPPRLIKESSRSIAEPVTKILNTAIVQGRYPSR